MSEYVDTKLINCNRLASVEARTGNNSNPAVFTNPLNETVKLDVGDKVSLERAFINEVGAGNPQTIEFKGVSTGTNIVSTYTDIAPGNYFYARSATFDPNYRLGYYRTITTNEVVGETTELKDNLAPMIFGYYITSNEYPNYIQQPRRFAQTSDTRGSVPVNYKHYSNSDETTEGAAYNTINVLCVCFADWVKSLGEGATTIFKQKVDNTRYTLFIKDKIAYTTGFDNSYEQFPRTTLNGVFSECTYLRVKERKDITVKKGFNTPSAIASQLTKQLTETRNEEIFEIYDTENFARPITKTIETTTYKPINAQNLYNFNQATLAAYQNQTLPATAANVSQDTIDYISTFGYIGVKRPEIFEAGRDMAKITQVSIRDDGGDEIAPFPNFPSQPELGFQIVGNYTDTAGGDNNNNHSFTTNLEYTEANCKKVREFFDTQRLYPELWDNLQDTNYYSTARVAGKTRPTKDNSRMFHFNPYTMDAGGIRNDAFGDDAFIQRTHPNNIPMTTVPWFSYYDDTYRDTFLPPRTWASIARDGVSYGFAYPVKYTNYDGDGNEIKDFYLIGITNNNVAGTPHGLFSEDIAGNVGKINSGRRFGYDFHSTAYSTAIITPYSGYSNVDIGTLSTFGNGVSPNNVPVNYSDTCNHLRTLSKLNTETVDMMPYMTMTYIGANNPEVAYNPDNNRFEFKRLHTGNNAGNRYKAGNGAKQITNETMCPALSSAQRILEPPPINIDAGDTVYKINPRPPEFGYSPTFKPYSVNDVEPRTNVYPNTPAAVKTNQDPQGGSPGIMNSQLYNKFNNNIRPYTAFDSHGGVYIDNWGFSRDDWLDSLWDILGYDYDAVNSVPSEKNVLTQRIDNENSGALYRPTTNAEVVTTDTKAYISNQFGASQYYTSLPYPSCIIAYRAQAATASEAIQFIYNGNSGNAPGTDPTFDAVKAQPLEIFDEVAIKTQSTTITATDLQKSVLRPYYTIRSNILEGATAIGGNPTGANLPIISIVDKYSGASDYFLGNPSDLQFTVTKPTTLADITTSIHDSDGTYANVNRTSAVVYKVEKVRTTPIDLISQLLQQDKKKK